MVIKTSDNLPLVERQQVEKAVLALRTFVVKTSESSKTKNLLDILDSEDVQLQFSYKLVPKIERQKINVVLDHSLVASTASVCLFVKDLVKVREYEKSVHLYQDILASRGITQQIEIFPLKKLKLEYSDYEAKRNLSNAYDVFLCDARITRLLPALLGKHFIGRKRFPLQVRLDSKDLKKEFNTALHTSTCDLSGRGSSCQMTVGNFTQSDGELTDNILTSVAALGVGLTGGPENIRNLVLKTANSKALPLYLSLGSKADVVLPKTRRTREVPDVEEITTVLNAKVSVDSRGVVKIINNSKKSTPEAKVELIQTNGSKEVTEEQLSTKVKGAPKVKKDKVKAAPENKVINEPKKEVKSAPKDKVKAVLQDKVEAAPKDKVNAAPKDKVNAAPKDKVEAAPKDKVKAAPKDENKTKLKNKDKSVKKNETVSEVKVTKADKKKATQVKSVDKSVTKDKGSLGKKKAAVVEIAVEKSTKRRKLA